MAAPVLPDYVRALLRKSIYGRPVQSIELVQTHISYVFLVDDQVYKLKKHVDLGFLDFTTLERRKLACEAEVRLNRRGCPGGVYIGVEQLTKRDGAYHIGGEGETVDYIVRMRRLPRERMMDHLLERNQVGFEMIERLAGRLAELHRGAERGEQITRLGGFDQHSKNWRENLEQIQRFAGRTVSPQRIGRIERFAEAALERDGDLIRRRDADGWVRDCHGDLRSDAVCFDPATPGGICIYDCIEFNDAFRYSDTGLDAAFLAMDLDYRGRPDLSGLFIGLYAAAAGDGELPALLNLYKSYRAVVRGKVESLLLDDAAIGRAQKAAARRRARRYFALAASYARERRRRVLVMVTGPSGTGKSVLAGTLATRLGAVLISTDVVRRKLLGRQGDNAELDTGIYATEARERVYLALEREADEALAQGRPVVLDGTYIERRRRQPVETVARRRRARLLIVECSAPDEVVRQRQERRAQAAVSVSEGTWQVYLAQKAQLEPAREVDPSRRIGIDTTLPLADQIEAVTAKLRGR